MTHWIVAACLSTGLAFACSGGGGDGNSGTVKVVDLSAPEAAALCSDLATAYPERTVTCPDREASVGFESESDCLDLMPTAPACSVTVSQTEDCFEDYYAVSDSELCDFAIPPSCPPLFSQACLGE